MNIALIFPAYNEELTIKQTLESFYCLYPDFHYYIIDNNSTDNTNIIANEFLTNNAVKGAVYFVVKQGKSNAIRFAFSNIDADLYVMCDADTTYPADSLNLLLNEVTDNYADMSIGERHSLGYYKKTQSSLVHNVGNIVIKYLINYVFRVNLNDILSGYRVFSKRFIQTFPTLSEGFQLETEMTFHALDNNYIIKEVPIKYYDRPSGSITKINKFKDGLSIFRYIFNLIRHYLPLIFFSYISLFLFIAGLIFGYPVIYEFYFTNYINRLPLALLASSLIILSVIVFSVGLILDGLNYNLKRIQHILINNKNKNKNDK